MPQQYSLSDVKDLIGNLARPNYYQMMFSLPSDGLLKRYLKARGIKERFISGDVGLMCKSATIPGVSVATNDSYNFSGTVQHFAHTKMYQPLVLEFYCDHESTAQLKGR